MLPLAIPWRKYPTSGPYHVQTIQGGSSTEGRLRLLTRWKKCGIHQTTPVTRQDITRFLSKYLASAPSVVEMYMHQEEITCERCILTTMVPFYIDKREFIKRSGVNFRGIWPCVNYTLSRRVLFGQVKPFL